MRAFPPWTTVLSLNTIPHIAIGIDWEKQDETRSSIDNQ
jgi:hypothetical protein